MLADKESEGMGMRTGMHTHIGVLVMDLVLIGTQAAFPNISPGIGMGLLAAAVLITAGYVGLLVWEYFRKPSTNKPPHVTPKQENRDDLIPLPEAAIALYEQTRTGFEAKLADRLDRSDADNGEEPGDSLLRHYINSIVYDESIPLFGSRPPSEKIIEIPLSIKKEGDAVGGGKSFQFLSDKKPTYRNLHIRRSDLEAKIREIGEGARTSAPDLIPFLTFYDMAVTTGWPEDRNDKRWIDLKDRLRESARNNWVQLWGRPEVSNAAELLAKQPREPIPADHWRDFEIEYLGMLAGVENMQMRSYNPALANWGAGKRYRDLHIERSAAAKWLAENRCQ